MRDYIDKEKVSEEAQILRYRTRAAIAGLGSEMRVMMGNISGEEDIWNTNLLELMPARLMLPN